MYENFLVKTKSIWGIEHATVRNVAGNMFINIDGVVIYITKAQAMAFFGLVDGEPVAATSASGLLVHAAAAVNYDCTH